MKKIVLISLLPFSLFSQPNQGGGPFPVSATSNTIVNIFSNVPGVYAVSNAASQPMLAAQLPWQQGSSNYVNSLNVSNVTIYGQNALITTTNLSAFRLNGNDSLSDLYLQGVGLATNDYQTILAPVNHSLPQNMSFKRVTSIGNSDGLVGTLNTNSTLFVQDSAYYSHFDAFNVDLGGSNSTAYIFNTLFQCVYTTNVLPSDGVFGQLLRAYSVQGGITYLVGCTLEARGSQADNGSGFGYNAAIEASQSALSSQPCTVYLSGCRLISATTNGGSSFIINVLDANTWVFSDFYIPENKIGGGHDDHVIFPGKTIKTNFISGLIYTNYFNRSIDVSTTAILTVTTVAGDATMEARAISSATNRYTIQTIVGTLGTTNGSYLAVKVPVNGTYTFTNTSAGSGDSSTILGGQIFVY